MAQNINLILLIPDQLDKNPSRIQSKKLYDSLIFDFLKSSYDNRLIILPLYPFKPNRWLYEYSKNDILEYINYWVSNEEKAIKYITKQYDFYYRFDFLLKYFERNLIQLITNLIDLKKEGVIEEIFVFSITGGMYPERFDFYKNIFKETKINYSNITLNPAQLQRIKINKNFVYYPMDREIILNFIQKCNIKEGPLVDSVKIDEIVEDIYLGSAIPNLVHPGEEFVIYFTSYTGSQRKTVNQIILKESGHTKILGNLGSCRWQIGTKISVQCVSKGLVINNSVQHFTWNGQYHILRFDAKVNDYLKVDKTIIKLDVTVEGITIIHLRPELKIEILAGVSETYSSITSIEKRAPETAFASYAHEDQIEVLNRVRSLQIRTRMDIFLDHLSLIPGENWKSILDTEIKNRQIFLLFWSQYAIKSEFVDWEWRKALEYKTIQGIEPHPLEPEEIAPAPNELKALQFGGLFEWALLAKKEFQ